MAIVLSKLFIRSISQPFDHTQTGISLWTLEDIENRQVKEKEEAKRLMQEADIDMIVDGGKSKESEPPEPIDEYDDDMDGLEDEAWWAQDEVANAVYQ